jgi:glycosyltransferase involved in cell wall biosynthesis
MRVLMVTSQVSSEGQVGGAGIHAYYLSRELTRRGHHVDLIATPDPGCDAHFPFAVYGLQLSRMRIVGMLKWSIAAAIYSMKLAKKNRYDILHVHHRLSNLYPLMCTLRIPMIATMHEGWPLADPREPFPPRRIINFLIDLFTFKRCRAVIVLNRDTESRLLRWGVSREKIRFIPNGVDCSEILDVSGNAETLLGRLHVPQGAIVVLHVGRLIKGKGLENLLEAWQIVQGSTLHSVWMIVVGDGPLREDLVERSRSIPNIVFAGSLSRGDLLAAYAESDLFVLPSEGGEGMPTVLLEAMAAGLPVVATRIPGISEIANLEFAKLVNPGDSRQLALALLDMIHDATSLRLMGTKASLVSSKYDWSIITSNIVNAYESCQTRYDGS